MEIREVKIENRDERLVEKPKHGNVKALTS
jgi:hypothetical protein